MVRGELEDPVPPVLGAMGVLDTVKSIIGDNQGVDEILGVVGDSDTGKTMVVLITQLVMAVLSVSLQS